MKGHKIELIGTGSSSSLRKGGAQKIFDRLAHNKVGRILASYDESSLNCMKFAHYLPIYQGLFEKFADSRVNMLEIGVQHGGSYRLWSNFFGEDLLCWTGLDIEPKCLRLNEGVSPSRAKVFLGSQSDSECLKRIAKNRGLFDIIIDDGSHKTDHIKQSFEVLSKYIRSGGVYVIEDVHASYWKGFRGVGEHLNIVSYFQEFLHSLNSQAVVHPRRAKDIDQKEILKPPAPMTKIEFLPSMIICHMGEPDPLIEWWAGTESIQNCSQP